VSIQRVATKELCHYNDQTLRGVAQPGSAPAWGAGGRWFKSSRPDHRSIHLSFIPFFEKNSSYSEGKVMDQI
jgi:hypothetical protein